LNKYTTNNVAISIYCLTK